MTDDIIFGPITHSPKVNLAQIISNAQEYLSNPATIAKASEKRYPSSFPTQNGLQCVANALANAILYIEGINPSRQSLEYGNADGRLVNVRSETVHEKNINNFLKLTPSQHEEMRALEDVKKYIEQNLEDYTAKHPKSGLDLLEKLVESKGYAAAILIPNGKNELDTRHATMVYARKNENKIELVEIDSLNGQERVMSTENFIKKIYPHQLIDDPYIHTLLIENKETEIEFISFKITKF